jgi:hypothetical protein
MPEIDEDDLLEIARVRVQATMLLFALAYGEIALALTLATFSIYVPRLFLFMNGVLFGVLILFVAIPIFING